MTKKFGAFIILAIIIVCISVLSHLKTKHALAATSNRWDIRSVSSMKETRDKICYPDSPDFIKAWVSRAKELGINYISIETPYDNPSCGNSVTYTRSWVNAIRQANLKVWHRHVPLGFEGSYGRAKTKGDYFNVITDYIHTHPDFFASGDIFTPITEPQNGGIRGVNYCPKNICQFTNATDFNRWLRASMTQSANAFKSIGLDQKIRIGYFGFDGFIAWGSHNPDWHGILEDATVAQMGNITIDHYPQLIGQTMAQGLDGLQKKYPNTPIVIGEWGAVANTDPVAQINSAMSACTRPNVVGFNYWHMGLSGNEALINNDLSKKTQFDTVASYFKSNN